MDMFSWVVPRIKEIVQIVIEEGGVTGPRYNEYMEEGFKHCSGIEDINKCRHLLDSHLREQGAKELIA